MKLCVVSNFYYHFSGDIKEPDAKSSIVTETHFDVCYADNLVLMATVNGSKAERNLMIPLFAKNLISASEKHSDLHEIFLKTNRDIIPLNSGQVAEMRSTLRYKLGLRSFERCLESRLDPSRFF